MGKIERIVDAIIRDLTERSGLGDEWDQISENMKKSIRKDWIELARKEAENF